MSQTNGYSIDPDIRSVCEVMPLVTRSGMFVLITVFGKFSICHTKLGVQ
jgi:hypothetical protein